MPNSTLNYKRAPKGEGCVRQKKNGSWEATIQIGKKSDGKPLRFSKTAKDKEVAIRLRDEAVYQYYASLNSEIDRLKNQTFQTQKPESHLKFIDVMIDFMNDCKRGYVTDSTLGTYQIRFVSLKKFFKDYTLDEITTSLVEQYLKKRVHGFGNSKDGICVNSAKNELYQINETMEYAVDRGYIENNPLQGKRKPRIPINNKLIKKIEAIPIEDCQKLMALTQNDLELHTVIVSLLFTGLRISELLGVSVDDINLKNNSIKIYKAYSLSPEIPEDFSKFEPKYSINPPKTPTSNRIVYAPRFVLDRLLQLHDFNQKRRKEKTKKLNTEKYIFVSVHGKIQTPRNITDQLKLFSKKKGIPYYSPHKYRHTFTTMMIRTNKIDAKTAAQILGHTDVKLIYNTYLSVFEEDKQKVPQMVSEYFVNSSNNNLKQPEEMVINGK